LNGHRDEMSNKNLSVIENRDFCRNFCRDFDSRSNTQSVFYSKIKQFCFHKNCVIFGFNDLIKDGQKGRQN